MPPPQPFDSDKFVSWLRDNGATFPHLEIKTFTPQHRGVVVSQDLDPQTAAITIPLRLLITDLMGRTECDFGRAAFDPAMEAKFSSPAIIAVVLYVMDTMRQPNHFFQAYYASLPTDYSNFPIFWNQSQLSQWLRGSPLIKEIRDRCRALRDDFDEICRVVAGFRDEYEFEDFLKIRSAVGSRNFGILVNGQKRTTMVPLGDMLNHRRPRETSWTFDSTCQSFVVTTLTAVASGQALLDSYGRKSNSRFLLHYGFALEDNREEGLCQNEISIELIFPCNVPSDDGDLLLPPPPPPLTTTTEEKMPEIIPTPFPNKSRQETKLGSSVLSDPLEPLKRAVLGVTGARHVFRVTMNREDRETNDALTFARVAVATKEELNAWLNCHSQGKLPRFVSARNEVAALELICNAMRTCLRGYEATYEFNRQLLRRTDLFPEFSARRCALIIVTGEQQIATHWIRISRICSSGYFEEDTPLSSSSDDWLSSSSSSPQPRGSSYNLLTKLLALPKETQEDIDMWRYISWLTSMLADGGEEINAEESD